jgi:hypothetical protein
MRVYTHARSLHARRRWCRATPMTSAQLKPMTSAQLNRSKTGSPEADLRRPDEGNCPVSGIVARRNAVLGRAIFSETQVLLAAWELPLHPVYVTCPQIRESRQLRGVPDRLITSTPTWTGRAAPSRPRRPGPARRPPRCRGWRSTRQGRPPAEGGKPPGTPGHPGSPAAHRRSPRHRPRRVVLRSAASCREWGGNQPIRPNRRSQNLRLVSEAVRAPS